MGRERKGSIVERDGKLYVRAGYTDSPGKKRELLRILGEFVRMAGGTRKERVADYPLIYHPITHRMRTQRLEFTRFR